MNIRPVPAQPDTRRPARQPLRAAALALAAALLPLASLADDGAPAADLGRVQEWAREGAAARAPAGARIEIVPGSLDPRLRLAPCRRIEPYLPAGARLWGRTRVGLRCTDGPTAWNVFLPVTVKVWAPALVARTPLPAGTTIDAGHLEAAVIDWAAGPAAFTDRQALVGRTLARPLAAGDALRRDDLRPHQRFAAGDPVRIVARGSGFAISGAGQAMSHGLEGELARVRIDNGRVVVGRVVGEREIEIAL